MIDMLGCERGQSVGALGLSSPQQHLSSFPMSAVVVVVVVVVVVLL